MERISGSTTPHIKFLDTLRLGGGKGDGGRQGGERGGGPAPGPARRSSGREANVLKLSEETAAGKNLYSRNTQLDPHLRP